MKISSMKTLTAEVSYMGLVFRLYIETYPEWLELPLTGTNFHDPKSVRATEVLLYRTSVA